MTKSPLVEQDAVGRVGFWNIGRVNPVRTLTFCAIGALAGLGIAGYGLFTATGTTTAIYPAEDAAIVNGVPVLMVDLVGQVRALYDVPYDQATKAQKAKALDDMIREELYVQRGIELGLPTDDTDVRTALVGAAEAQTASEVMTTVPTRDALKQYYAAHREKYASEGLMDVAHWVVPETRRGDVKRIVDRLRGGARAQELGLTPSGSSDAGEQFYFAARIHLGNTAFEKATAMRAGTVSDPIETDGRLHILVMKQNKPPVVSGFDSVQARVLIDYMEAAKKQALAENTKFLHGRAKISVAPTLR